MDKDRRVGDGRRNGLLQTDALSETLGAANDWQLRDDGSIQLGRFVWPFLVGSEASPFHPINPINPILTYQALAGESSPSFGHRGHRGHHEIAAISLFSITSVRSSIVCFLQGIRRAASGNIVIASPCRAYASHLWLISTMLYTWKCETSGFIEVLTRLSLQRQVSPVMEDSLCPRSQRDVFY
jgi:hypothetical protein